jgi:hypothetical protein
VGRRLALSRRDQARLADAARRADRALLEHPALMAYCLDTAWQTRVHTERISRALAELRDGTLQRLMIFTPPQIGKSTLAVEWFVFWWLCNHQAARVVIGSYGKDLATRRGRRIRALVRRYGHRWDLQLEQGASSVTEWSLTTGGGVKSVGVGSGVTGSPGDLIVIDDPHKSRADAESLVARDTVAAWYSADMFTRRSPRAPIVIIQTRWHHDDLSGRLLAQEGDDRHGGRWRVLRMPAYADKADDPLGRDLGAPLSHPRIPEHDRQALVAHWEEARAAVTVRDWFALYMADPKPIVGVLVDEALLRARRHHPMPVGSTKSAVGVDPSGGGRDQAGVIGGHLGEDGRLYFTHDRSITGPSTLWGIEAAILAAEIDAELVVIEKNYGGDQVAVVVRSAWDAAQRMSRGERLTGYDELMHDRCLALAAQFERMIPEIRTRSVKKNKVLKAEPVGQQWKDDRIRTGDYLPELEQEWTTWRPTDKKSPGRIDASCILAYEVLPIPGAEQIVSSPAGVKRSQIRPDAGRPRIQRARRG